MKKRNLFGAVLCSMCLITGSAVPAMADSMRVVTLGADLTDAQKNTMMKYFKVNASEVETLTVTNQDERDHLSSYVPLEQIGTRTVSCAFVRPTTSGGIKVRTANLNWVTGNMIATTLSTSGVRNCEVVAACPFEVSGTGALTGIQMAYETASGEQLDETKKELATEEMVVTGNFADDVGKNDATTVINQAKMEIIQNNVQNADEIYNIVVEIAQQNNISVDAEQLDTIVSLLEQIAQQGYNYDDMKDTLERVDENVTGEAENPDFTEDPEAEPEDEESIIDNVDDSALGDDVISSSTEDPSLEEETGMEETPEENPDEGEGTGDIPEALPGEGTETLPDEGEGTETLPDESEGTETLPDEGEGTEAPAGGEFDTSVLSEQALSQFEKAKVFCLGEYEGDAASLQQAMQDETAAAAVVLDSETGKKLSTEVEKEYYTILSEGTGSYVATGMESYMSTELNMMDEAMKKLFGMDETAEQAEDDILASVSEEDKAVLYADTMKFFEMVYGETVYEEIPEEQTEGTEGSEGTGEDAAVDEIPEAQ